MHRVDDPASEAFKAYRCLTEQAVSCFQMSMEEGAAQPASVSLGKGAWDCDLNVAIPPEKEVSSAQAISTKQIWNV